MIKSAKYFALPKAKKNEVRVAAKCGVAGKTNRLVDEDNYRLFGTGFTPILAQNSPLLHWLIVSAHTRLNHANPCLPMHLNPSVTKANLRSSLFAVSTTDLGRKMNSFISNCAGCLRINLGTWGKSLPTLITTQHRGRMCLLTRSVLCSAK